MSEESQKWTRLTQHWSDSLTKAKVRQAIIDDKMNSFLKGNGCLPSQEELKQVEELWELHVEARNKTNIYIATVIKSYPAISPNLPEVELGESNNGAVKTTIPVSNSTKPQADEILNPALNSQNDI